MLENLRWNLTSHGASLAGADVIVVSIPKSGRTWLRVLIQSYLCAWDKQSFDVRARDFSNPDIPTVAFTHDLFEHQQETRFWRRVRGWHLIPRSASRRLPILLLARDPRDAVVSLYFQLSKRAPARKRVSGTLSEFIRHPQKGIRGIVLVMNRWLDEWQGRPDFRIFRYEDLRKDVAGQAREILGFLGVPHVDEQLLRQAAEFSSFENMRAMEQQGRFREGMLKAANTQDPESFKVRKGVVGGYREYLSPEDIEYVDNALRSLDSRFGYGPAK
jgi:hypothetical protein